MASLCHPEEESEESEDEYEEEVTTKSSHGGCCELCAMLIHFLVANCRLVVVFLYGYRSTLRDTATFMFLSTISLEDAYGYEPDQLEGITLRSGKNMTMSDMSECVQADVSKMMRSPGLSVDGVCITTDHNYWGIAFLTVAGLCLLLVLAMLGFMIKFYCHQAQNGQSASWKTGRYLDFTWKLFNHKCFKCIAYSMLVFASIVIVLLCFICTVDPDIGVVKFMEYQILPLGTILLSAYGLTRSAEPKFVTEKFKRMVFKRSMKDMFFQTSDDFAHKLEHAMYRETIGDASEMEALVDYKAMGYTSFDAKTKSEVTAMMSNQ